MLSKSLTLLLSLCLALLLACGDPPPQATPQPALGDAELVATEAPGEGYVVWESNRTGDWRLWLRDLDGSPPRQLTPDADNRQHCCAHIAPGGERVAYLSLPRGTANYPKGGASGRLHTIRVDGTDDRVIYPEARTYWEHRAVVWRNAGELLLIDADGSSRLLDVAAGTTQTLTPPRSEPHGWLLNGDLTHATTGTPSFSPYDAEGRRINEARVLGGCQPYFSHDSRWGYWMAGAGGPILALDLASGNRREILGKSDPRLPQDQAYLYFPMLSHDGLLFAWGASANLHDHATSDYDIYAAATDPETLEIVGQPWRVTEDPSVDRFPDIYSAPLALGRHFGEAPLRVALEVPEDAPWQWTVDGAGAGSGRRLEHLFEEPGTFRIEASHGDVRKAGSVRVRPAEPPQVETTALRGEHGLNVYFNEVVDLEGATFRFASGLAVASTQPTDDRRGATLELERPLDDFDTLVIEGVRDTAQSPNTLPRTEVEIAPPAWPSDGRGLLFLWQTVKGFNEVTDPATGSQRTARLSSQGRAWLDRNFAMELAGGTFVTDDDSVLGVFEGARRTNELTLEATLTPARSVAEGTLARIITFSGGTRSRNFTLGQIGDRLVFRLRTATTGNNADKPQIDLGPVTPGQPTHVVVTYTPGRLRAYLDGRQVVDTDALQDGFFHWKPRPLIFGSEWPRGDAWHGRLEGVAIYDRPLSAEEAAESHRRYAELLAERPSIDRIRLRARLERRSEVPSLDAIAPYREALALFEYRVEAILDDGGSESVPVAGSTVRVVHRVLADAEALPIGQRPIAQTYELTLEPFFDHEELEALVLSETLESPPSGTQYFSADVD
ncbi:MAG: LamG-like jellyroll fold domain-containing protein [Acidobacteriota bacterium]